MVTRAGQGISRPVCVCVFCSFPNYFQVAGPIVMILAVVARGHAWERLSPEPARSGRFRAKKEREI